MADRGRGTGSLRRRTLGWLAVALAVALVAVSITAYLKFRSVWDSIGRVEVVGLGTQPPKFTNALNILLIGSDSRAGPNKGFGKGITGQRSDTIIVLHIAPDGRNAIVLSIPRDSVVPVLACPPEAGTAGQSAQPGQVEQINATFAQGGPGCLWKTIEQTTRLHIDHFIELDFTGFEHVVDDIGGVNVCLPFAINDPQSRLHLSRGQHHVYGREALAFWRARYIGEGSDLERIQRDQFLMASVLQGIERSDLRSSPSRLVAVITDVARSMTTDSGLSLTEMISLTESLRGMRSRSVQFIELPTVAYQPDPNWVTWPATDTQLFAAIAHDRAVPKTARRPAARPTRAALANSATRDVSVRVLNGAGIAGIGQQAASTLAGKGIRVAQVGDAPSFTHQVTVIEYPSAADLRSAAELRSVLGGGVLRLDPGLKPDTLTVIVGADFAATSHPTPAATSPAATPAPARSSASAIRKYGGISGSTNVCHDQQAFAGPRGGA